MIVNCPSCSANYRIKTEIIDPQKGRVVRCSACGNSWRVFVSPMQSKAPVPEKPQIKEKQHQQKPTGNNRTQNRKYDFEKKPLRFIKFLFMLCIYGALFYALYAYRFKIVKNFPQTERFYKLFNADVQVAGISIFKPYLEKIEHKDGHTSILIAGTFVNSHRQDTLKIPALRISLLNSENMPIKTFVKSEFKPDQLPPAGRSDFSYKIPAIPKGTVDVRIEFDTAIKP